MRRPERKSNRRSSDERAALGVSASVNVSPGQQKRNAYRAGYTKSGRFFSGCRVLDKTLWYLTDDGSLVAYHGITRRMVGSLTPQETSASGSSVEARFIHPNDFGYSYFQPYQQPEILASARTAYLLDLEKRELKPLFTVTNGDAIVGFSHSGPFYAASHSEALILTRTSIRWLNSYGQTKLHVPYSPSPPAYPSVSMFLLEPTNTYAVWFEPDYVLNEKAKEKLPTHVEWINPDQTIRNVTDLPRLPGMQQAGLGEKFILVFAPPAFPIYPGEESFRVWNFTPCRARRLLRVWPPGGWGGEIISV